MFYIFWLCGKKKKKKKKHTEPDGFNAVKPAAEAAAEKILSTKDKQQLGGSAFRWWDHQERCSSGGR